MSYIKERQRIVREFVTATLVMGARRGSEQHLTFDEAKAKIETSIEPMSERLDDLLISGKLRVPTLEEANEIQMSHYIGK